MPDPINGNAQTAPKARTIVITFSGDGDPSISLQGGVTPSNLAAAVKWLDGIAEMLIGQKLQEQMGRAETGLVLVRAIPKGGVG